MPYRVQIIRSNDFVRLDAHGNLNIYDSQAALRKLAEACMQRGIDDALLDVREVQASLTVTDLFVLASSFGEFGFHRGQRLAIVHRMTSDVRAGFFALCAKNRGWSVGSFDNFEEAFAWLNEARTHVRGTLWPETLEADKV